MFSGLRDSLLNSQSNVLNKYLLITGLLPIFISAILPFINVKDIYLAVIIFGLAAFWFIFFSAYLRKKHGRPINKLIIVVFTLLCVRILDGGFMSTTYRAFTDLLLPFLGGVYLCDNKVQKLNLRENLLLLFAPIVIIFVSYGTTFDKLFQPLAYAVVFSITLIVVYYKTSVKFLTIIVAILLSGFLAFLVYPNYFSLINGKQLEAAMDTKFDARIDLPLLSENGDSSTIRYQGDKIVVLDFWYSGCGVCFTKFPELNEFADRYAKDTSIFVAAVNIPLSSEMYTLGSFDLIKKYTFNKLQSKASIEENKWLIEAYPTVLVFDKNHKLRYVGSLNTNKKILLNNMHSIIEQLKKE